MKRRKFIGKAGWQFSAVAVSSVLLPSCSDLLSETEALQLNTKIPAEDFPFKISLAQWSLNNALWSGKLDHLKFAQYAQEKFAIDAVEYVNQFFYDKAEDFGYLRQMNQRAGDHGVSNLLIMIDLEGSLATQDDDKRLQAVENHYKWIDAAKFLGCHSIRVNAAGKGDRNAVANAAVESLGRLSEYGAKEGIHILVENHGGHSSDAAWLSEVIMQVNNPFCGTLPDFGNFRINLFPPKFYDPIMGMKELMPYAKGVSAKSREFDGLGQEKTIDFRAMISAVKEFGYNGHVGIEYEGYKLSEDAGIMATKNLLIQSALSI